MKENRFTKKLKLSFAVLTFSLCGSAFAEFSFPIPDVPKIDAATYILIDANSGDVLAQYKADEKRDPASLTKMMTSYVIGEALKSNHINANDMVTVSRDAWATGNPILRGSSLMFLEIGKKVSVEDLNKGIIIQSGNDASIAMAEHVAGSQDAFVNLMNNYAEQLGLTNTHFKTVHGLDSSGQYTTARDMATLGQALIKNLPNEYAIYKEKEFKYNISKPQKNRNGLLWDTALNVDGIKTGHTNAAGYSLVASAVEGNTRLISVVLGTKTERLRESESKKLLLWGFRFFETAKPLQSDQPLLSETIWYGDTNKVKLGSLDDVAITVPRGQVNNIKINYNVNPYLYAPIDKGTQVGTIQFVLDDKVVAEKPLVTLEPVAETGFFGQIWDYIKLKFYQLFN